MNKILLFVITFILSNLCSAQDIGFSKWGDNPEDVMKAATAKYIGDNKIDTAKNGEISYNQYFLETILGVNYYYTYNYIDNKLVSVNAKVTSSTKGTYDFALNNFKRIVKQFNKQVYGRGAKHKSLVDEIKLYQCGWFIKDYGTIDMAMKKKDNDFFLVINYTNH